jgi:hypothetical protein
MRAGVFEEMYYQQHSYKISLLCTYEKKRVDSVVDSKADDFKRISANNSG